MSGYNTRRQAAHGYLNPHKARRILNRDAHVCYVCGHDGAGQVDHVVPWAEWTRTDVSVHDASNLAAIHGGVCGVCGRACHADKSKAEARRGLVQSNKARANRGKRPAERHPGALG